MEGIFISYTLHNEFSYDDAKNLKFGEKVGEHGIWNHTHWCLVLQGFADLIFFPATIQVPYKNEYLTSNQRQASGD